MKPVFTIVHSLLCSCVGALLSTSKKYAKLRVSALRIKAVPDIRFVRFIHIEFHGVKLQFSSFELCLSILTGLMPAQALKILPKNSSNVELSVRRSRPLHIHEGIS